MALDGLRGLAITLVVAYHCFKFPIGWVGVDLFFVLSGFLIGGILIDNKRQAHYFHNFWIKRILRIFPLYYLVLILFIVFRDLNNEIVNQTLHWSYWLYLPNWFFTYKGSFDNGEFRALNHFWSLAIEEQFYLLFPFLVKFLRLKPLSIVLTIFIIVSIMCRWYFWQSGNIGYYVSTFSRLDALSIGALLAIAVRVRPKIIEKAIKPVFLLFTVFLLLLLYKKGASYESFEMTVAGITSIGVVFCCVVAFSLSDIHGKWFRKLTENRILVFLGKISYGLYVYHWIIYMEMKPIIQPIIEPYFSNTFLLKSIVAFIVVLSSLLLSILSYRFVESNFLMLKSRLTRRERIAQDLSLVGELESVRLNDKKGSKELV